MPVRGVLLDLEGVLYEGDLLIEGATGVVKHLVSKGFSIRYLTNTTVRPKRAIAARMEPRLVRLRILNFETPDHNCFGLKANGCFVRTATHDRFEYIDEKL